jgi:hypothetical protein
MSFVKHSFDESRSKVPFDTNITVNQIFTSLSVFSENLYVLHPSGRKPPVTPFSRHPERKYTWEDKLEVCRVRFLFLFCSFCDLGFGIESVESPFRAHFYLQSCLCTFLFAKLFFIYSESHSCHCSRVSYKQSNSRSGNPPSSSRNSL